MMEQKFNHQSFTKQEKLKSKKLIDFLINDGQRINEFPLTGIWAEYEINSLFPAQMGVSISKRKIKKAVERNLLKRRIREIYRKNKLEFYDFLNMRKKVVVILFIYHSEEILSYADLEKSLKKILKKIMFSNA